MTQKVFNRDDADDRKRGGLNTDIALVLIEGYSALHVYHSDKAQHSCNINVLYEIRPQENKESMSLSISS